MEFDTTTGNGDGKDSYGIDYSEAQSPLGPADIFQLMASDAILF